MKTNTVACMKLAPISFPIYLIKKKGGGGGGKKNKKNKNRNKSQIEEVNKKCSRHSECQTKTRCIRPEREKRRICTLRSLLFALCAAFFLPFSFLLPCSRCAPPALCTVLARCRSGTILPHPTARARAVRVARGWGFPSSSPFNSGEKGVIKTAKFLDIKS